MREPQLPASSPGGSSPSPTQVLAERRQLAITAARITPPAYITKELGERPSDPAKREAWDRGVAQIEGYRQENGITDPSQAFGSEANGVPSEPARSRRSGGCRRPSARLASAARGESARPRARDGDRAMTDSPRPTG